MSNICVVMEPDSNVGVITNSSSMLFVQKERVDGALAEKMVETSGLRWWFGEQKVVSTSSDLVEFMSEYGHVAETIFPGVYGPERYFASYQDNPPVPREHYEEAGFPIEAHADANRNRWKNEFKDITRAQSVMMAQVLGRLPFYYYACGEDGQLSEEDWRKLDNMPMMRARLS